MDFYPSGVRPPAELISVDYLLRPLRATDVDLDYEAVMEHPAMLRLSGGGVWPADDFTREANLADLVIHEREHENGVAFIYTVMNLDQSQCLGCVYVNQLSAYKSTGMTDVGRETFDDGQAIVRFWVRHSRLRDELDWRLLNALIEWFTDNDAWWFSHVYFRAHDLDERQRDLMTRAGLPLAYSLELSGRQGLFLAYGPVEMPGEE